MSAILRFSDNDDRLLNPLPDFDESWSLLCFEDNFWDVVIDLKFVLSSLYNSKSSSQELCFAF